MNHFQMSATKLLGDLWVNTALKDGRGLWFSFPDLQYVRADGSMEPFVWPADYHNGDDWTRIGNAHPQDPDAVGKIKSLLGAA